ncbi:MAG: PAS domain-containing protein [Ignavibacterium sp.]|nr:PAS domain-containing protein [Ignavibacterium sp.]
MEKDKIRELLTEQFDHQTISGFGDWKELFLSFFDISQELLFILNADGYVVAVNKNGSKELDYTPTDVLGKHFTEFIDAENIAAATDSINKALKEGSSSLEVCLISKFEVRKLFLMNLRVIRNGENILGLLGSGKNISNLKKLENELKELKPKMIELERLINLERSRLLQQKSVVEELNKLKNEFMSNISHELRTPLASIVGFSETIASDPNMPDEMKIEFNYIILNEGKRLARLINEVLELSRMETGKLVLSKSKIDIVRTLRKVIDEFVTQAVEKNITLSVELPHDELLIDADDERLSMALRAVINNAIKFTREFGRVKIILNNLFREVEIIVADTGIGIPQEQLPNIFQKFHKASRPIEEAEGVGVGLVFVKQIVDLHKGLINIQSEENKGTTVIIRLLKNIKDKN